MAYSDHFIKKVLKLKSEGMSFLKLSNKFSISVRSIQEWIKGNLPKGKRTKANTKLDLEALRKDVELYPDAYLYERAERLGVKKSCIGINLKKIGVTYKKPLVHPKADEERRELFKQRIKVYEEQGLPI